MSSNKTEEENGSKDLRSRAESIVKEKSASWDDVSNLSIEQLHALTHELRIHQIELELQNQELRETQQELTQSRDAFIDLYEFAPVGYLTMSDKGMIAQANLTAARMFGSDRGILLKKPLSTIVAQDDQDKYYLNFRRLKKDLIQTKWELRLIRADGVPFEGELQVSPILDTNGNFQHHFKVIIADISDRKKAEEELTESERRLRSYFEAPLIGVSITLPEKGVLEANDMACQMLGYSKEELSGMTWVEMTHPDDIAENLQHFERLRAGEIDTFRMEKRFFRKDGEIIWVDLAVACVRNDDGSLKYTIAFLEDVSKRVAAEKELQASEKRFRELVEFLPQGIFEADTENRFTFANSSQKHISGVLLDEDIIGKFPTEFVDPLEHKKVFEHYEAVKKGLFYEQEYMGWEQNGVRHPDILVKVARIMSDDQLVGFRGVVTDISSLKQAEGAKQALQKQLFQAQKLASLGTLVGGIAHDFNNMLQIIIGYSELLMADIKHGRDDPKLLENILETAEKAADMVTKFMALGQQSMVETKLIDLNEKIRDVESLILSLQNIAHLDIDLMDEHTIIKQNPDQLGQIIMILATNASEAMPGGGRLSLSTTRLVLDEDECNIHVGVKPGPYVLLTVADTGRGMDEVILSQIFDPFFSTKERCHIKGMGLGLPVLMGMVQQRGGFVTCESELGKGTTFRVYFPEIQASVAPTMMATEPGTSMPGEAILIVEDDINVAGLEKNACNRAGYSTILASNGRQAVEMFKKRHAEIGLAILDIIMPDMNGRDCLMELLKINPLLKVIVLSGHDPMSEISLAVKPYVMTFLTKPCQMSRLVAVVQTVMKSEKDATKDQ